MESINTIIDMLMEGSKSILTCNNRLTSITKKVTNLKVKTVWKYVFFALLVLSLIFLFSRYLFLERSRSYGTLPLVLGLLFNGLIFSLIFSLVLLIPIKIVIETKRKRVFLKFKPEIDSILAEVREIEKLFLKYPEVPLKYLNEFYLNEMRQSINDEKSLEELITNFQVKLGNNQTLQRKEKIVNIRYNILTELTKLAKNDDKIDAYDKWLKAYSLDNPKKYLNNSEPPTSNYY